MNFCSKEQNLLPNSGFEDIKGTRPSMYPWQMVNTIDYFVYEKSKEGQIIRSKIKDKNFKLRPARSGKAYVGLRVWPKYTEFLLIQLDTPLKKDEKYYFEMYVILSPHANCKLRSIGVSVYSFKPPYSQRSAIYEFPPQFEVYKHQGIGNTSDWYKIAGVFTAVGGERFLSIGNFSKTNSSKFKIIRYTLKKREAYYYIDDVALYKLDNFGYPIIAEEKKDTDTINQPLHTEQTANVLDDYYKTIEFPANSAELTYESYSKLAFLIDFLNSNTEVELFLVGFAHKEELLLSVTDPENELLRLSQKRARVVYNFMTGNRIVKSRLHLKYSISEKASSEQKSSATETMSKVKVFLSTSETDKKLIRSSEFQNIP